MRRDARGLFIWITIISFIAGICFVFNISKGGIITHDPKYTACIVVFIFLFSGLCYGYVMHISGLGQEKDFRDVAHGIEIVLINHLYVKDRPVSSQIVYLKSGKKFFISKNKELSKLSPGDHFTKLKDGSVMKKAF